MWREAYVEDGVESLVGGIAVEQDVREECFELVAQVSAEILDVLLVVVEVVEYGLEGGCHSDDAWHVFCACPELSFLGTAAQEYGYGLAFAYVEEAHAFGSVELVCGGDGIVNGQFSEVDGVVSKGLDHIHEEEAFVVVDELSDGLRLVDCGDFVVGVDDADEGGSWQRFEKFF